jgi:hypothetical protein
MREASQPTGTECRVRTLPADTVAFRKPLACISVKQMWFCPNCGEQIDDVFEACWKCGTAQDGTLAAAFHAADPDDIESLDSRVQPDPSDKIPEGPVAARNDLSAGRNEEVGVVECVIWRAIKGLVLGAFFATVICAALIGLLFGLCLLVRGPAAILIWYLALTFLIGPGAAIYGIVVMFRNRIQLTARWGLRGESAVIAGCLLLFGGMGLFFVMWSMISCFPS